MAGIGRFSAEAFATRNFTGVSGPALARTWACSEVIRAGESDQPSANKTTPAGAIASARAACSSAPASRTAVERHTAGWTRRRRRRKGRNTASVSPQPPTSSTSTPSSGFTSVSTRSLPIISRQRARWRRPWKSSFSKALRPACQLSSQRTTRGSKPQTPVAMSRNSHHAVGPGARAPLRPGSQREASMAAASGRAPNPSADHGAERISTARSSSERIASSVVDSQKKPMCFTNTKPAKPQRMPRLKAIPAVCASRASRQSTAARGAPPPSIRCRHHESSAYPAKRRASFPASTCTPLKPSPARPRRHQPTPASSNSSHWPPMRMTRNRVTSMPPLALSNKPCGAASPARNAASASPPPTSGSAVENLFPAERFPPPSSQTRRPVRRAAAPSSPHTAAPTAARSAGGVPAAPAAACSKSIKSSRVHRCCASLAIGGRYRLLAICRRKSGISSASIHAKAASSPSLR